MVRQINADAGKIALIKNRKKNKHLSLSSSKLLNYPERERKEKGRKEDTTSNV